MSIIGLAETYALLSVATQGAFGTTPIGFFTSVDSAGRTGSNFYGYGYGQNVITLRELIENPFQPQSWGTKGQLALVGDNVKKNALPMAVKMAMIPVAFRLGKSLARPAISRTNRLLSKTGIGSTVKL
jgi:hypothetical protein